MIDNFTINSNEEVSLIGISREYEWSRSHWIRPRKSHAINYVDSDIILGSQTKTYIKELCTFSSITDAGPYQFKWVDASISRAYECLQNHNQDKKNIFNILTTDPSTWSKQILDVVEGSGAVNWHVKLKKYSNYFIRSGINIWKDIRPHIQIFSQHKTRAHGQYLLSFLRYEHSLKKTFWQYQDRYNYNDYQPILTGPRLFISSLLFSIWLLQWLQLQGLS